MSIPTKILEVSGSDWMKGISIQDEYAIGGAFKSSCTSHDPFDLMGHYRASLSSVQVDGATITKACHSMVAGVFSGVSYVWLLADRTGTGANNIFRIKTSDNSVIAASLTGGNGTGAVTFHGLVFDKFSGNLYFEDVTNGAMYRIGAALTGEAALPGSINGVDTVPIRFHQGEDGLFYFNKGGSDGKVASVDYGVTTPATFTVNDSAFQCALETTVKDITSDGRYLIIAADKNPTYSDGVNSFCKIYFWDYDSANADIILDIPDKYLISCRWVDGRLLVIGASGIWQCGIGTPPRLIFPLTSVELPVSQNAVTTSGNIMYWTCTSGISKVYAYGAKVGKPILFAPYISNGSQYAQLSIIGAGTYFYIGVNDGASGGKAYVLNTGLTRDSATVVTCPTQLPQPYRFSHAKVVLKNVLTTGQQVILTIANSESVAIMAQTTKSFAVDGAKRTFIFNPSPGTVSESEDLFLSISTVGATVSRVTVYGVPIEDNSQIL